MVAVALPGAGALAAAAAAVVAAAVGGRGHCPKSRSDGAHVASMAWKCSRSPGPWRYARAICKCCSKTSY